MRTSSYGHSRRPSVLIGVCVAGLALGATAVACGSSSGGKQASSTPRATATRAPKATPAPVTTPPSTVDSAAAAAPTGRPLTCPAATVTVSSTSQLKKALSGAQPGTVIKMADATYSGQVTISQSGTQSQPIWLCGSKNAVLDGKGSAAYELHLEKVSWVRVAGFSVENGKKGVVADGAQHSIISGLYVAHIGDEAIHLRAFSLDNEVVGNVVRDTGHLKQKFGEGIYVGSAKSNWKTYSGGQPDASNNNSVIGNNIADTTAESIDIKEGTVGGLVSGNRLSSQGMVESGADSWIDVKGNNWVVQNNVGTGGGSIKDGIQTHVIVDGDGVGNTFRGNRLDVDGKGYGIYINKKSGNTVSCNNQVAGASSGTTNVACSG